MSYNFGRPAFFAGQESIAHCRRLLDHPLAVKTDSRLVAACELLTLRGELHYFSSASFPDRLPVGIQQPFSIWPTVDIPNLDEKIKQANIAYEAWERDWDEYYGTSYTSSHQCIGNGLVADRLGVSPGDFMRETRAQSVLTCHSTDTFAVITQRCHAM